MAPLGLLFRKFSGDTQSSNSSTDSLNTITSGNGRNQLFALSSPSSSTLNSTTGTLDSIAYSGRISPSGAGLGWGKVISDGGSLSVHTLGVVNGKHLDVGSGLVKTETGARLAELRKLMKAEPEPLDY
jgi:hypothetical protein